MKYDKLRIAWSVAWGVVAILLCVLWVRSYSTLDMLTRVDVRKIQTTFGSEAARAYFAYFNAENAYEGTGNPYSSHGWSLVSREMNYTPSYGFLWKSSSTSLNLEVPYWALLLAVVITGALSWLPWSTRFSLRTLLIATTFVAIGLSLLYKLQIKLPDESIYAPEPHRMHWNRYD